MPEPAPRAGPIVELMRKFDEIHEKLVKTRVPIEAAEVLAAFFLTELSALEGDVLTSDVVLWRVLRLYQELWVLGSDVALTESVSQTVVDALSGFPDVVRKFVPRSVDGVGQEFMRFVLDPMMGRHIPLSIVGAMEDCGRARSPQLLLPRRLRGADVVRRIRDLSDGYNPASFYLLVCDAIRSVILSGQESQVPALRALLGEDAPADAVLLCCCLDAVRSGEELPAGVVAPELSFWAGYLKELWRSCEYRQSAATRKYLSGELERIRWSGGDGALVLDTEREMVRRLRQLIPRGHAALAKRNPHLAGAFDLVRDRPFLSVLADVAAQGETELGAVLANAPSSLLKPLLKEICDRRPAPIAALARLAPFVPVLEHLVSVPRSEIDAGGMEELVTALCFYGTVGELASAAHHGLFPASAEGVEGLMRSAVRSWPILAQAGMWRIALGVPDQRWVRAGVLALVERPTEWLGAPAFAHGMMLWLTAQPLSLKVMGALAGCASGQQFLGLLVRRKWAWDRTEFERLSSENHDAVVRALGAAAPDVLAKLSDGVSRPFSGMRRAGDG